MTKNFEGKTEKEAINKAMEDLGLNYDQFDVEILSSEQKKGLFGKSLVKILVHYEDPKSTKSPDPIPQKEMPPMKKEAIKIEKESLEFVSDLIEHMGFEATINLEHKNENEALITIDSPDSGDLIGKKGQTLESIQVLVNGFLNKILEDSRGGFRVIVDIENYRLRKEEQLIELAQKMEKQVIETRHSVLLEEMSPSERRIVHQALNDSSDVHTFSEGDGLYKRIRVSYIDNQ